MASADKQSTLLAKKLFTLQPLIFQTVRNALASPKMDIAPAQLKFMRCLNHRGKTVNEIAELMGVSPPTASATVSQLEKKGYLLRKRSNEDRRVVHVTLTAKGEKKMAQSYEQMIQALSKELADLSTHDTKQVMSALSTLQQHLSNNSPHSL